ncbi:peptidase associated/transthyretin-like domain-containing protein [Roseimaritima ulvae]|uniref:Carboxypeptidase regulatory-like domain-containing protein n=1 Tax=Roseimaritima ulvae TaxID=980254 RepID=A0A5B9RAB7_9BACT|nr:Ig-like domain-containing protein [Roseimaritima ulvae]QEG43843.1 hypothetical protein UC8_59000 [Roseimaritima ulvae]
MSFHFPAPRCRGVLPNGAHLAACLRRSRWITVLLVGSWLTAFSGCGPSSSEPLAAVKGTVTAQGQPLVGADVMFIPEGGVGAPSGGKTDAQGAFELQYTNGESGAVIGKHRVVISVAADEPPPPMGGSAPPPRQTTSPEYYKQAEVTEAGENEFTFEVAGT